jgi:hypothetical protein
MRLKCLFAAAIAAVAVALASPVPGHAFGDRDKPHGWGKTRHIHHWVYYPRYVHHYKVDPYAYQYSPRGYYPYYGSAYWQKASYVKWRNRLHYNKWNTEPPRFAYYKSWGYPRHWHHYAWHKKHHGYHHRWHW